MIAEIVNIFKQALKESSPRICVEKVCFIYALLNIFLSLGFKRQERQINCEWQRICIKWKREDCCRRKSCG